MMRKEPWTKREGKQPWSFTPDVTQYSLQKEGIWGNLYHVSNMVPAPPLENRRPGEASDAHGCNLGKLSLVNATVQDDVVTCKMICWHRFKIWWMRPVFTNGTIPPETIMILLPDREMYRLILPNGSCSLQSQSDGTIWLYTRGEMSKKACLYFGIGPDPYTLIDEGVRFMTNANTAKIKQNNAIHSRGFGWCTWNALYTQVTGPKLVDVVQSLLQQYRIPIRWIIIDDGWQHTTNDDAQNGQQWSQRLSSLRESPSKFNASSSTSLTLMETIVQLRQMGLEDIWVWHTLMGYWLGLDPESEDLPRSKLYFPHFSSGLLDNDKSAVEESSVELGIGIPESPNELLDHYHEYLERCGVTGVKVDAQGVVGTLRPFKWNDSPFLSLDRREESVALNLHKALANSVLHRFGQHAIRTTPPVLHCMAHDPEILYQFPKLYPDALPLLRASDDYYPNNPYSHGPHVVDCAFNSILLSHVSVPDWDMFTTSHQCNNDDDNGDDDEYKKKTVRLHAISRCLSGGPIYISDPPAHVNHEIVEWICCQDGSLLTCRETALPIHKCLWMDPLAVDSDPLVIFNTNGRKCQKMVTSGVFGIFHLAGSGTWDYDKLDYGPLPNSDQAKQRSRTSTIRPLDIPHYRDIIESSFLAVPFFQSDQAKVLASISSEFSLELDPMECEAVAILPILCMEPCDIAILGLAGKINGAGAVLETNVDERSVCLDVIGCGTFLIAIRSKSDQLRIHVMVDTVPIAYTVYKQGDDSPKDPRIPMGVLLMGFDIIAFQLEKPQGTVPKSNIPDEQHITIQFE